MGILKSSELFGTLSSKEVGWSQFRKCGLILRSWRSDWAVELSRISTLLVISSISKCFITRNELSLDIL